MSRPRRRTRLRPGDAGPYRFAVVVSRTNPEVTDGLLAGALDTLKRYGASEESIQVVEVPGSFELPMTAARIARTGQVHAIICLGALVRGETPHFDYLARAVAVGIETVAIDAGVPVAFGVLTCDSYGQALARAGGGHGNKGTEAAVAAIEMARTFAVLPGGGDGGHRG